MGTKPKTRFIVNSDGNDRELFSVRVSSSGQLRILPTSPRMAIVDDVPRELKEQHISVHNSNGGKDTSVTLKQHFTDGRTHDYVTFLADTAESLLWPVMSRRAGTAGFRAAQLSRDKDTFIRLPAYQTSKATLFYSVYISVPSADFSCLLNESVTVQSVQCGRFTVTVLSSFINIPSTERGHIRGMSTSPATDRGMRSPEHFQIERSSLPLSQAIDWHWDSILMLRDQMITLVWPTIENRPPEDKQLFLSLASFTTAVPINQTP